MKTKCDCDDFSCRACQNEFRMTDIAMGTTRTYSRKIVPPKDPSRDYNRAFIVNSLSSSRRMINNRRGRGAVYD